MDHEIEKAYRNSLREVKNSGRWGEKRKGVASYEYWSLRNGNEWEDMDILKRQIQC